MERKLAGTSLASNCFTLSEQPASAGTAKLPVPALASVAHLLLHALLQGILLLPKAAHSLTLSCQRRLSRPEGTWQEVTCTLFGARDSPGRLTQSRRA